jgi:hypothetical protein
MPLIQRDIGGIGGFEVSRDMILIAPAKGVLQQSCAVTVAMTGRIDADQRQVPVRLLRMVGSHRFEHGGKLAFPSRRQACPDCLLIELATRREPKRYSPIVRDVARSSFCESAAAKRVHQYREAGQILRRLWIGPAGHRIRTECERKDGDCPLDVGGCDRGYGRNGK